MAFLDVPPPLLPVWLAHPHDRRHRFTTSGGIVFVAFLFFCTGLRMLRHDPELPVAATSPAHPLPPGGGSIYANHRLLPRPLPLSPQARTETWREVREAQLHAFDRVEPVALTKPDLEAVVGRVLPPSAAVTTAELSADRPISAGRRRSRVVYFITPTYRRDTQMADLVRMSQMLQAAAYSPSRTGIVYWIVVEDGPEPTWRVRSLLERSGLPFAHAATESPPDAHGRGMRQRNLGLGLARAVGADGVLYFADDDNAYDADLAAELTLTRAVSVLAVGLVGNGAYERCHVDPHTGRVDRLISGILTPRRFGIDMAGFAVSTGWDLATNQTARFEDDWAPGSFESRFLEGLVPDVAALEPLAANCTRVLVWHTKTSVERAGVWEMEGDEEWALVSALV